MSQEYYNDVLSKNPTTVESKNFNKAWQSFFNNGYSGSDYQSIFDNFKGSELGNKYKTPLKSGLGGYLIFYFLLGK